MEAARTGGSSELSSTLQGLSRVIPSTYVVVGSCLRRLVSCSASGSMLRMVVRATVTVSVYQVVVVSCLLMGLCWLFLK